MPTIWGDEATFGGRRPKRNAPVVQRLQEEGAIVLGKTAISRFGFWFPGKARNPHNPEHTPGSSSSGSAAVGGRFHVPACDRNPDRRLDHAPGGILRHRRHDPDPWLDAMAQLAQLCGKLRHRRRSDALGCGHDILVARPDRRSPTTTRTPRWKAG